MSNHLSILRKIRIRSISTALITFLILLVTVLAARPPTTQAGDYFAGDTTELIARINTANGNSDPDTITLTANIWLSADLPWIISPITIEGNDHIVDGTHDRRVFYVASTGNLTLNEVRVSGGRAGDPGAGIYNDGGKLTLTNSTVTNSYTVNNNSGGGIGNLGGGVVTITNSTISGNDAWGGRRHLQQRWLGVHHQQHDLR